MRFNILVLILLLLFPCVSKGNEVEQELSYPILIYCSVKPILFSEYYNNINLEFPKAESFHKHAGYIVVKNHNWDYEIVFNEGDSKRLETIFAERLDEIQLIPDSWGDWKDWIDWGYDLPDYTNQDQIPFPKNSVAGLEVILKHWFGDSYLIYTLGMPPYTDFVPQYERTRSYDSPKEYDPEKFEGRTQIRIKGYLHTPFPNTLLNPEPGMKTVEHYGQYDFRLYQTREEWEKQKEEWEKQRENNSQQ